MNRAGDEGEGFDAAFAAFEPALREETFAGALALAARRLKMLSGVEAVAIFTLEGGKPAAGAWHPERAELAGPLSEAMAHEAARAVRGEGPGSSLPDLEGAGSPRAIALRAEGRTVGVACLAGGRSAESALSAASLERILALFALRIACHQEAARAAALQTKYERWFSTLDNQIRVLDRERQKFAALVHQTDAAMFVVDTSHTIVWTNSVLAAEPSPEPGNASWIGLHCSAACSRFAGGRLVSDCGACPVTRAMLNNQVTHHESHRGDGDATRNHYYLTALPIQGPNGRPYEVMVMIQDLADLEILRRSESRYRVLFERSGKAIVMADPETRRILLANPMASRLLGCPRDEMVGMPLEQLHSPGEWLRLEPHYALGLDRMTLDGLECRVLSRTDGERIATVSGAAADFDGREVLMLEYSDVTEPRHAEEALKTAQERLLTVVSNAPVVLFAIGADGIFTMSEGRGLETLGLKPGQVVGLSVYDVYRDFPPLLDDVRRAFAGEDFSSVVEIGELAFDIRWLPVHEPDGGASGLIGIATDVTGHRRLEDQLRQSQKMEAIGRLAGGVAHDFNNLLAAIMGHGELVLGRIQPGHPLHRNIEEMHRAATRGAMLTRQLLAFSRKEVLAPTTVDVSLVVAGMEGMLRRLISEDILLVTACGEAPLWVRIDRGQVEQVVMNLAVNARDAMPRGGRITIEAGATELDAAFIAQHPHVRTGPHVLLTVSDDGCGMDAETLAHIFEPFFTNKEPGKGTGLGLATVYGIVRQNGGHIGVYSEPGLGTTFRVYLPCVAGSSASSDSQSGEIVLRRGCETVLLVEDEDAVRSMAREALETAGYTVLAACHGPEALALVREHPGTIHLLLTDLVMPQMNGRELAERLLRSLPELRVIYMSGYTDDSVVRHGVLEEGTHFLQKPFRLKAFIHCVREVLDGPPGARSVPVAQRPGLPPAA